MVRWRNKGGRSRPDEQGQQLAGPRFLFAFLKEYPALASGVPWIVENLQAAFLLVVELRYSWFFLIHPWTSGKVMKIVCDRNTATVSDSNGASDREMRLLLHQSGSGLYPGHNLDPSLDLPSLWNFGLAPCQRDVSKTRSG